MEVVAMSTHREQQVERWLGRDKPGQIRRTGRSFRLIAANFRLIAANEQDETCAYGVHASDERSAIERVEAA
jgi:hypothetical protein